MFIREVVYNFKRFTRALTSPSHASRLSRHACNVQYIFPSPPQASESAMSLQGGRRSPSAVPAFAADVLTSRRPANISLCSHLVSKLARKGYGAVERDLHVLRPHGGWRAKLA